MFYFQYYKISPRPCSIRSVHQTGISTSVSEQESDNDSDTEQEKVRYCLKAYYLRYCNTVTI